MEIVLIILLTGSVICNMVQWFRERKFTKEVARLKKTIQKMRKAVERYAEQK